MAGLVVMVYGLGRVKGAAWSGLNRFCLKLAGCEPSQFLVLTESEHFYQVIYSLK